MEQRFEFKPVQLQEQRQQFSLTPSQIYRQWRDDPVGMIPDTEAIKHASVKGGDRYGSLNPALMTIRRRILQQIEHGGNVNVGIQGLGSSGKSETAQAILYWATHDSYLHTEVQKKVEDERMKQKARIIVRTFPFSLAAKASQLPGKNGESPLVRPDADHGRFTEQEYSMISRGIELFLNFYTHPAHIKPGEVNLNILEGSGLPFPVEIDRYRRVKLLGMADRGISPIDNLAFNPDQSANTFIFLMEPNQEIQRFGLTERVFDPYAKDFAQMTRGRVRYEVSTAAGVIKNVDELSKQQQAAVARLLQMSMAPPAAAARSNAEFEKMKIDLADAGTLPDTSTETYMEALRQKLLKPIPGQLPIPKEQVLILNNKFWSGFMEPGSNVRNLDYLLRYCVWSQNCPELVDESLRKFLKFREEVTP